MKYDEDNKLLFFMTSSVNMYNMETKVQTFIMKGEFVHPCMELVGTGNDKKLII